MEIIFLIIGTISIGLSIFIFDRLLTLYKLLDEEEEK